MNIYIIQYLTIDNNMETVEIKADCELFARTHFENNFVYAKITNIRYKRFI